MFRVLSTPPLSPSRARELRAAYVWRSDALRAWEAAKRHVQRGISGRYYAELRAAEHRIDEIRRTAR